MPVLLTPPVLTPVILASTSHFGMYKAGAVLVCLFVAVFLGIWAVDTFVTGRKQRRSAANPQAGQSDSGPTYPKLH